MNRWKRSFASVLSSALLVFLLWGQTGCRSDKSPAEKALPDFVLVASSVRPDFDTEVKSAIKGNHSQNRTKYMIAFEEPAEENAIDDQIAIVEKLISQKVAAILIIPADATKIVPALKKAVDEGIVVINVGDKLNEEKLKANGVQIPRVGFDGSTGAADLGKELANLKLASQEVAIFAGDSVEANLIRQAYETSSEAAGMQVVVSEEFKSVGRKNMIAAAEQKALQMFEDHPNLSVILCGDSSLAVGAGQAVQQAQRTTKTAVLGIGHASESQSMLENGVAAAAVIHDERIGIHAVDLALMLIIGGPGQDDVSVPLEIEKGESYAKFAQVSESLD